MDKKYTKGMLKLRGDVRKLRNRARNKERALNAELIKRRTKNKDMQTRKGGMFPFFLLSSLFTFGHKLPIIGGLIKRMSAWYGKTTIWTLLVLFRKIFIILNALIGLYAVTKITGFSTDNIIAGVSGMGYTYIEMLTNFVKKLFNFIYDIFDTKVVPKPPENPTWKFWGPKENTWYGNTMTDTFSNVSKLANTLL